MKEIILVKNGELVLKGLNRNSFEDVLIKNMKRHLADIGAFTFTKSQSTIMVEPENEDTDLDDAVGALKKPQLLLLLPPVVGGEEETVKVGGKADAKNFFHSPTPVSAWRGSWRRWPR